MVVGKFVSKIIQALPSWEVTKYYGRVCWFQIQCLKYRIQTSEAWFNLKSKYMAGSLKGADSAEKKCDAEKGKEKQVVSKKKVAETTEGSCGVKDILAKIPKSAFMKEKLEKLRAYKKGIQEDSSQDKSAEMPPKSDKKLKKSGSSKMK